MARTRIMATLYVCTVTLASDMTLVQGHVYMTQPWVMDNNCVRILSRSDKRVGRYNPDTM